MKKNVGTIDKVIRLVGALAVFSLFFILEGNARFWALLGFLPLLTGYLNFCPLYTIFGISTCPRETAEE